MTAYSSCTVCGALSAPWSTGHRPGCEQYRPPASARRCLSCGSLARVERVDYAERITVQFRCRSCEMSWTEHAEPDREEPPMPDSSRRDLEVSAERTARALLAGATATPPIEPVDQLGQLLVDVPEPDHGLWLALVASAATAMHVGTLTALRVHGVDTTEAQARIALARETAIAEQDNDEQKG